MSVTASTLRKYWVEVGWAAFAAINFVAMPLAGEWETIPFHFVWVSLTLVYGFRVWRPWPTAGALSGVMLISGVALVAMATRGQVSATIRGGTTPVHLRTVSGDINVMGGGR